MPPSLPAWHPPSHTTLLEEHTSLSGAVGEGCGAEAAAAAVAVAGERGAGHPTVPAAVVEEAAAEAGVVGSVAVAVAVAVVDTRT